MSGFVQKQRASRPSCIAAGLLLLAGLGLSGCAAAIGQLQDQQTLVKGPAPVSNTTPMREALACIARNLPKDADIRFAVNDVTDGTGALMNDLSSAKVLTQRPDMMLIVALAQTGVRIINRNSIGVAEWELKQAMEKKLGEGKVEEIEGRPYHYRAISAGALVGSTHYVSGALTELNWNVKSSIAEAGIAGAVAGIRTYYISVAIDLMVTETETTEVVLAKSYSKQIVGREISAGLYRFFDVSAPNLSPKELFEFNVGKQGNEPVQAAVRWMIEAAAYDIAGTISGTRATCDSEMMASSERAPAVYDDGQPAETK